MTAGRIPTSPGSYALRLVLPAPLRLSIGRLGTFDFPAGDLIYLGSARGPGGLRGRLLHHLRLAERPRWHLDWLRPHVQPAGGWFSISPERLECAWSQVLLAVSGSLVPAPGFGASDCRRGCPAHLLAFPGGFDQDTMAAGLRFSSLLDGTF